MTNMIIPYRDDGPLAMAVGAATRGRIPPLLAAVAGAILPYAALTGRMNLAAIGAGWCALVAGLGSHSSHTGRMDWLVPPVLRATEYVFLGAVGFATGVPGPLVFALLCAVAYHHYDTVYRLRQRVEQPPWVTRAGLGWEGRMLIAVVAAVVGVATWVYGFLTAALGALFVAESVVSWVRAQNRSTLEDMEAEGPEE